MQLDYRESPNQGGVDLPDQKVGDYADPTDAGSIPTEPYPDNTMKWYDDPDDAAFGTLYPPRTAGWSGMPIGPSPDSYPTGRPAHRQQGDRRS